MGRFPGYDMERDGITQGLLDKFQYCRQACRWWLDGWEVSGGKGVSVALWFGNVWHALQDECRHVDGEIVVHKAKLDTAMFDSITEYGQQIIDKMLGKEIGNASSAEETAELENAALCLALMWSVYVKKYWRLDFACRWYGLEKEFKVSYKGYTLRGKRDVLILGPGPTKKTKTKRLRLVEYKTKSRIDPLAVTDTILYDGQVLFYVLATELEEKGTLVDELTYHLVRRPGEYQGKKETPDEFQARLGAKIEAEAEHYFHRFNSPISAVQKARFAVELDSRLVDFDHWQRGRTPTYRNTGSCIGRNYNCPYIQVCGHDDPAEALERLCVKREVVYPELA